MLSKTNLAGKVKVFCHNGLFFHRFARSCGTSGETQTSVCLRLPKTQYFLFLCPPCQDPRAWAVDASLQEWSNVDPYTFSSFAVLRSTQQVVSFAEHKGNSDSPLVPQKGWFSKLPFLALDVPCLHPFRNDIFRQIYMRRSHQPPHASFDHLEIVNCLLRARGFSRLAREAFLKS